MIRVGLIGAGAIARTHIDAYQKLAPRCEIVAVCDIDRPQAESYVARYHLNAVVTEDHRDLLRDERVDLVSICTPPNAHAEITVNSLRAGKHVLVEKPMATSLEECDAMLAAANESGRLLSVVAQNRFRPEMMGLQAVLRAGLAGRILSAQVDSFWWRGSTYYDLWWRGTWEQEGGGPTLNHAVHHFDLLLWMMGESPVSVSAMMANVNHQNSEVEDLSVALLRFRDGALGHITSSVVHHGQAQQLAFQGVRARVAAPWHVDASVGQENGFPAPAPDVEREIQQFYEERPPLPYTHHVGQIENVLSAVEGRGSLLVPGADGRRTLELIVAVYGAAAAERVVRLPIAPTDTLYRKASFLAEMPRFHTKGKSVERFGHNEITT